MGQWWGVNVGLGGRGAHGGTWRHRDEVQGWLGGIHMDWDL